MDFTGPQNHSHSTSQGSGHQAVVYPLPYSQVGKLAQDRVQDDGRTGAEGTCSEWDIFWAVLQ